MARPGRVGRARLKPPKDADRERFENPFLRIDVECGHLLRALPTEGDRRAYCSAHPASYYLGCGFFTHVSDDWPASTRYIVRGIFCRPKDEFMELVKRRPPKTCYHPPDTSGMHFWPESIEAETLARGRWWKAAGWPMTERERDFLSKAKEK